jgi:hypothetical protein
MTRTPLALISLALALGGFAAEAGASAPKPLPRLMGVPCHRVVASASLTGFSCGWPSDPRSYVVTIEVADHSPYGRRPEDVRSGTWVRTTRLGFAGRVYVMVVATRTDGDVKRARREATWAAKLLARVNSA